MRTGKGRFFLLSALCLLISGGAATAALADDCAGQSDSKLLANTLPVMRSGPENKKYVNSVGMEFIRIPSGKFTMGYGLGESRAREVSVGAYYLQSTPVTQEQWVRIMGSDTVRKNAEAKYVQHLIGAKLPVIYVSWEDAQAFVKKLNEKEKTGRYRLPTNAEWEYAYRAGTDTVDFFGNDIARIGQYAWNRCNSENVPHPVGTRHPNQWGLYDMVGNVFQWVNDWYDPDFKTYRETVDPQGPKTGKKKVVRGSSFKYTPERTRFSGVHSYEEPPDNRSHLLGFRLVYSDDQRSVRAKEKGEGTVRWTHNGTKYFLVAEGKSLGQWTVDSSIGDDLLVYDPADRSTYLLEDVKKRGDNLPRPAKVLESPSRAFWRCTDKGYFLYLEGKSIAQRSNEVFIGKDLLVFDTVSKGNFLLEDYATLKDNKLRPAKLVETPSAALWRRNDTGYFLYYQGKSIALKNTDATMGSHLLSYYPDTTTYFVLENYSNTKDDRLRAAKAIESPSKAAWRYDGKLFYLYLEGKGIDSRGGNVRHDDDVVFYDPETKSYFILDDFYKRADDVLRPASAISSSSQAIWKRKGTSYWIYSEGKLLSGSTNYFSGNDLVVRSTSLNKEYVLTNYSNSDDGIFRAALLK